MLARTIRWRRCGALRCCGDRHRIVAAPFVASHDPLLMNVVERLRPPSAEHWFGTDQYGRDIFSRTLYGGRVSVFIAVGVASGAHDRRLSHRRIFRVSAGADLVLMRMMDGLMAIPAYCWPSR